jgi:hypothetical protein
MSGQVNGAAPSSGQADSMQVNGLSSDRQGSSNKPRQKKNQGKEILHHEAASGESKGIGSSAASVSQVGVPTPKESRSASKAAWQ